MNLNQVYFPNKDSHMLMIFFSGIPNYQTHVSGFPGKKTQLKYEGGKELCPILVLKKSTLGVTEIKLPGVSTPISMWETRLWNALQNYKQ